MSGLVPEVHGIAWDKQELSEDYVIPVNEKRETDHESLENLQATTQRLINLEPSSVKNRVYVLT